MTESSSNVVNPLGLFEGVTEYWSQRIVDQVNDQYVKIAKVRGVLASHKHDGKEEFIYTYKGSLKMESEDSEALTQGS